ncbi:HNH nuclease [Brevundimonas phage vB_BpoS-Kikimora]|uniref:HNH nuclease n=1 Tax=Brevundimonas phage vB_BpoS-Kikimora TaxID=2948601 RepID=A0A9E7MT09_9CAUD|nr:HNH nuclease [Brevundimonas phage vB_BpoS-Kikimora]
MARRPKRRASPPKTTANTITRRRRASRRPRRSKKPRGSKLPVSYNHRTHPSKITRQPPGHCRWCGVKIFKVDGVTLNLRRSWCGQTCVNQYLLRSDPKVMRQHVFLRDEGKCAKCGKVWNRLSDKWQADHVVPLFLAFGDWSFWEPENVQILCTDPCHKEKSASDMARYGFVIERKSRNTVKTQKKQLPS